MCKERFLVIPAQCVNELFEFLKDIAEIQTGKAIILPYFFVDKVDIISPKEFRQNFDAIRKVYRKEKTK